MATGQFFKLDMDAWDDGTAGLTLEQQGAYLRILNQIYRRGASVLSDAISLGGYLRCHPNKARALVEQLIDAGKLAYDHTGRLMNGRANREIEERRQLSETRAQAGRQGGRPANLSTASPPAPPPSPPQLPPPHHAEVAAPKQGENSQKTGIPEKQMKSDKRRVDKRRVDTDSSGIIESFPNSSSSDDDDVFAWEAKQAPAAKSKPKPPTRFDQFWAAYPRKVGKDAARRAFIRIAKAKRITFDELMAGLERYKQNKPMKIDFCHPATWLNEGRWADEYSAPRLVTANGKPVDTYLYDPSGFMRTA